MKSVETKRLKLLDQQYDAHVANDFTKIAHIQKKIVKIDEEQKKHKHKWITTLKSKNIYIDENDIGLKILKK